MTETSPLAEAPLPDGRKNPYDDKLDDPWSSHNRIRRFLSSLPPETRVLDVGASTGTLGRMCAGLGLEVSGVEPDRLWAEVARPHYSRLLCSRLEDAPDGFLEGHDVVVCADVLEHLPDADHALRRLVGLQPEGCLFIISVPNVANLWIRLNLLLGRFEYADRGILDRTHLRFFTWRTLLSTIRSANLALLAAEAAPIPLGLVHKAFRDNPVGRFAYGALNAATGALPRILGYQFVVRAMKPVSGGR